MTLLSDMLQMAASRGHDAAQREQVPSTTGAWATGNNTHPLGVFAWPGAEPGNSYRSEYMTQRHNPEWAHRPLNPLRDVDIHGAGSNLTVDHGPGAFFPYNESFDRAVPEDVIWLDDEEVGFEWIKAKVKRAVNENQFIAFPLIKRDEDENDYHLQDLQDRWGGTAQALWLAFRFNWMGLTGGNGDDIYEVSFAPAMQPYIVVEKEHRTGESVPYTAYKWIPLKQFGGSYSKKSLFTMPNINNAGNQITSNSYDLIRTIRTLLFAGGGGGRNHYELNELSIENFVTGYEMRAYKYRSVESKGWEQYIPALYSAFAYNVGQQLHTYNAIVDEDEAGPGIQLEASRITGPSRSWMGPATFDLLEGALRRVEAVGVDALAAYGMKFAYEQDLSWSWRELGDLVPVVGEYQNQLFDYVVPESGETWVFNEFEVWLDSGVLLACDRCGEQFWNNELHEDEDDPGYLVCNECDPWSDNAIPRPILNYSHTPDPLHFHELPTDRPVPGAKGILYMGMELEASCNPNKDRSWVAREMHRRFIEAGVATEPNRGLFYIKADVSVENGFEIVTHPFTPAWGLKNFPFGVFEDAISDNLLLPKHYSTGQHIHISKRAFTPAHLTKFLYLHERLIPFIAQVGGRSSEHRYATFSPYKDWAEQPKAKIKFAKGQDYGPSGRNAVNLSNAETIELRYPAGDVTPKNIRKNMEWIDAIFKFSRILTVGDLKEMHDPGFMIFWIRANKSDYPTLNEKVEEILPEVRPPAAMRSN